MSLSSITITLISLLSIVGMGSILYSLIFEKEMVIVVRKKPPQYYPTKINSLDDTIETVILDF